MPNPLLILTPTQRRAILARIGNRDRPTPWRLVGEREGVRWQTAKDRVTRGLARLDRERFDTADLRRRMDVGIRRRRVRDAARGLVDREQPN